MQSDNPHKNPPDNPLLPGLGICAGIFLGIFAWQIFLDDWLSLSSSATWFAQGVFFAVSITVCSLLDGVIRPHDWRWGDRVRGTLSVAMTVVLAWSGAAIGEMLGDALWIVGGWLLGGALGGVIDHFLRPRRQQS